MEAPEGARPVPAGAGAPEGDAPAEDLLAALICSYDDAMALGLPPTEVGPDDLPEDLRDRYRLAREAVDLLNQAWPRDGLSRLSTDDFGLAPEVVAQAETGPIPGVAAGPFVGAPADGDAAKVPAFELPGFRILGPIGRGGMGLVFRAVQLSLNRVVALKVLRPDYLHDAGRLRRFRNEAKVAASLTDSSLLPLIDVIEFGGVPVMVMPYIEGTDLGRIIAERRLVIRGEVDESAARHPWSLLDDAEYLAAVTPLLDRVVRAVSVMHASGVIHRDIKPSNVLLDRGGNVWLTDFGLARLLDDASLTREGAQLGTPGYMSPEQWQGVDDLDRRADVFGLGVLVYQALTLQLPYGQARLDAACELAAAPSRLQRRLDGDHDAVLMRAIEPDRAHRYTSAVEFHEDWQRVRDGVHPHARRIGWFGRLVRRAARHPWRVVEVVVWLVLGGLIAGLWMR